MKKLRERKAFTNPAKNNVLSGDDTLALYLKEIINYVPLSLKEEKALAKRASEGDIEAKKMLIQSNLRLVPTIARKVIHKSSLPMIDLIQEGNLGLMSAVEKFNWKLGYKFSTYASWWIKQSMFKAISEQSYCMKIPVYIQETLSKFSKVKSKMEQEYSCQVKNEQVAKKMNIAPNKIDEFLTAYSKTISIDSGISCSNGSELNVADILEDEKQSVAEKAEYESLKDDIQIVVSTLKDREQDVIKMRYGLENFAKKTLEEIGNIYGVTKECIRQTELRALKKLRGDILSKNLLSCYM